MKERELILSLDNVVNSISVRLQILNDIEVLFGQLDRNMEDSAHRGEQGLHFDSHLRQVRVLSELMLFTMREMNQEVNRTEEITVKLFKAFIKEEQKNTLTNMNSERKKEVFNE